MLWDSCLSIHRPIARVGGFMMLSAQPLQPQRQAVIPVVRLYGCGPALLAGLGAYKPPHDGLRCQPVSFLYLKLTRGRLGQHFT